MYADFVTQYYIHTYAQKWIHAIVKNPIQLVARRIKLLIILNTTWCTLCTHKKCF